MLETRSRPSSIPGRSPLAAIPAAQARALDKRLSLDEQQRAYRSAGPKPQPIRPRPPA